MVKTKNGFTVIEVLIVLAIVGLIMTIVFLAFPALQRNTRNHQRKADVVRAVAFINEQKQHHLASLPPSCNNTNSSCFLRGIELSIYDNLSDSENNVSFWNRTILGPFNSSDTQLLGSDPNATSRIQVRSYAKCDGNQLTGVGSSRFNLAVQFGLEQGYSDSLIVCYEL